MASDYQVRFVGADAADDSVRLDEDGDLQAVKTAFSACSPYGHSLWDGRRFLGCFEPGEVRLTPAARSWRCIVSELTPIVQ